MITQEGISAAEIGEAIQQYVARNREITATGLLQCGKECGMMFQDRSAISIDLFILGGTVEL